LLQEELYVNKKDSEDDNSERFSVLAIAFFNIGVEQEHMYQYAQSYKSYKKGSQVSSVRSQALCACFVSPSVVTFCHVL